MLYPFADSLVPLGMLLDYFFSCFNSFHDHHGNLD
ncbi:hypothetical protein C8C94_3965 [Acidovorax sp. 94]|nr:hypothetical protein C8C94_3965 [Acidovorax sp. 94]